MSDLREEEFRQMCSLLTRYGNEMDQWDMFQLPGDDGPIYIGIGLAPLSGTKDEHYRKINTPD